MKTNEIILAQSRAFLNENYAYHLDKESGTYAFEIYTDYDEVPPHVVKEMAQLDTKEEMLEHLYDYLFDAYEHVHGEVEYEVSKEIQSYLLSKFEGLEEYDDFVENYDVWDIRSMLVENEIMYSYLDYDVIIKRTDFDMVVMYENEESANNEYAHNSFYSGLVEWIEVIVDHIKEGDFKEEDISLINLLKSQGYTLDELYKVAKDYYENDVEVQDTFLSSVIEECENTTSLCNSLVFLQESNLYSFLRDKEEGITIAKDTACGYVDFIYGAGSVLGINLKKDITLPKGSYKMFVDGNFRYSVKEIFGEFLIKS